MKTRLILKQTIKVMGSAFMVLFLTSACATTTTQPKTGLIKGSAAEKAPVAPSGFLGDYSKLKPGPNDRAALVYVNPKAKWSSYHSIIVDPVQFWSSDNTVPLAEQKVLTSYFYDALRKNLQPYFVLVDKPGPGVLELKAAITSATAATPVLRSVSVVVPQARLLNTAKSLTTGSYAFVGSAQAEGQVIDSVSKMRLAAAVDKREGGMALETAAQWKWGDVQNILDYWAQNTAKRLAHIQEHGRVAN
ncbi:MAG: DUF3313 domain-containing protein [Syntrophobacteraceae bacterium]